MTPENQSLPAISHDEAARRFEVIIGEAVSVLDYAFDGDRVIFTHTFVPPELRGRSVAEQLVRTALGWARAERKRVVPECSYVAKFIERHPDYRDLLVE